MWLVNTQISFIPLPQSQNNCKSSSLYVGLARIYKSSCNCLWVSLWPSISCLPTLHWLIWEENYNYWSELGQKVLQYLLSLSHGSVTAQCFSPHHQHHLQHLTSSTSPEKEKVDSFCQAVTLPIFSRSLGCLKLFYDFHLSIFDRCTHIPASLPDYHENHLIWGDSSLVIPLQI